MVWRKVLKNKDMKGIGNNYEIGKMVIEGKKKKVLDMKKMKENVMVIRKESIKEGDGVKENEIEGKDDIYNEKNGKVFEIIKYFGMKNEYVKYDGER
jgi:phosphoribosylaminoimidazole carboxylase/phosphoribosylaminoimidazole-succinocarboxamide synthase